MGCLAGSIATPIMAKLYFSLAGFNKASRSLERVGQVGHLVYQNILASATGLSWAA